jgi:hypothetical protein
MYKYIPYQSKLKVMEIICKTPLYITDQNTKYLFISYYAEIESVDPQIPIEFFASNYWSISFEQQFAPIKREIQELKRKTSLILQEENEIKNQATNQNIQNQQPFPTNPLLNALSAIPGMISYVDIPINLLDVPLSTLPLLNLSPSGLPLPILPLSGLPLSGIPSTFTSGTSNSSITNNLNLDSSGQIINLIKKDEEAKYANTECIACRTNKRIVVALPCGHISMCISCNNTYKEMCAKEFKPAKCPICNANVQMWANTNAD